MNDQDHGTESSHSQTAKPATAQQLEDVEKQMSGFERSTLVWARVAAVMSFIAAVFICAQWYEMHTGGQDTHTLAEAAKKQADKSEVISDSIQQAADDMDTSNDQARDTTNRTLQQSKATLDATINSARLDQRAWVGVLDAVPSASEFSETRPFMATVTFFNSGRTPAQNVQSSAGFTIAYAPLNGPDESAIKQLTFGKAQSIAPQGRYIEGLGTVFAQGDTSTPDQIKGRRDVIAKFPDIKSGKATLYYFGILKYDDIFSKPHRTNFCIFLADPSTKQIGFCNAFNDLN
jgi:cell division protein FtsL